MLWPVTQLLKIVEQFQILHITKRRWPSQILLVAMTVSQPLVQRDFCVTPGAFYRLLILTVLNRLDENCIYIAPACLHLCWAGTPFQIGVISAFWINLGCFQHDLVLY